jgi:hypothetical protein
VPSLTEVLDNLYTTTWQNMKSPAADQIYDATPFWFWMKDNGRIDSEEGGRFLTEPLRFAKSDNVKFIQKGGTVSLADKEFLTIAKYDWRYLVDSIVRFGVDDQQNRGKNQIISLMKAKLDNSKDSLSDKIETVLFGSVTTDPIAFHGLLDIVPDDPTVTAATLGGIDPSVDTWWRSKTTNMNTESMATLLRQRMTTMVHSCMNNIRQDRPDLIMSGQTPFEAYESQTILQQRQIVNQKLGDAGFTNLEFKGIPMVWSPSCANTRMYFLNTKKHLRFKRDPMMNFDMTDWKAIPDQVNDRAAQIILAGNLVTGRRRCHGVIFNMNTP